MANFMEQLTLFTPAQCDGYIDVTLPVLLATDWSFLHLHIIEGEESFRIVCPDDIFAEQNGSLTYYFTLFSEHNGGERYGMQLGDDGIYRDYPAEHSVRVALSDFVRFFLRFDDFIIDNDILGNEENFPLK